jgi:hypothetical protein
MNEESNTVISRFVAVWVWSVLVGANVAVTFGLAWYGVRSHGPVGLIGVGPFYLAAMIASFVAWCYVVLSLRSMIASEFDRSTADAAVRRLSIAVLVAIGLTLLLTAVDFALRAVFPV